MDKRKSTIALLLASALLCSAQIPQKLNYQAVVRNAEHVVVGNQDVGFRLSILEGSPEGTPLYVETHTVTTNPVGVAEMLIGDGSVVNGVFSSLPWADNPYFLKVEADPSGGTAYDHLGTSQLVSVPYALYSANISSPTRKFTIQEDQGHPVDSALFEVRNAEGQTVFAVYPEGTRVFILDEGGKGLKGGFAVGGYSRATKGPTQEYLRVTPDSIRMYFDETASKGLKGGFAVGGYGRGTKGITEEYFTLKPDSAKFTLISDQDGTVANALSVVTKPRSGILENPKGLNLFNLTRDNYFIGHRAGESLSGGAGNCFFGFESGMGNTTGYGNIFIGEESGHTNSDGSYNTFIGFRAGQMNRSGINNVSIGFAAGQANLDGSNNIYLGSDAGLRTIGNGNIYVGTGAGANNFIGIDNIMIGRDAGAMADTSFNNIFIGPSSGHNNKGGHSNVFVGYYSGLENMGGEYNTFIGTDAGRNNANGRENTFLGSRAGFDNMDGERNLFVGLGAGSSHKTGSNNVYVGTDAGNRSLSGNNNIYIGTRAGLNNPDGRDNIFIGHEAGADAVGNGQLFIDLFSNSIDQAFIHGEIYNKKLRINNHLGIGMSVGDEALAVNGDAFKTGGNPDWETTSDGRVKTDIATIDAGLEMIMQLRPVTFRYSETWLEANPGIKDKTYYHFVAQEFARVFPEGVRTGPETLEGDPDKLLRMNSHPAQVVAIRAIQELAEQNRKQQELIEMLTEKMSALEEQLSFR